MLALPRKVLRRIKAFTHSTRIQAVKSRDSAVVHAHLVRNALSNTRPKHIVIVGPARSGTTLLFNMLRHSAPDNIYTPESETPALNSLKIFASGYITKRPLDLYEVESIKNKLGQIRDLKLLIMVRDPRALVTSMHNQIPHDYYQSWDFGHFTGPYTSFTRPGVGTAFAEIDKIQSEQKLPFKIIKFEDLVAQPDRIQAEISEFTGLPMPKPFSEFHTGNIPDALKTQLNGVRPPDKANADRFRDERYSRRLATLHKLFPDMQDVINRYGYSMDSVSSDDALSQTHGIVVGMHTPDTTYRAEAHRMKASMDRLDVKHSIDELPPAEDIAGMDCPDDYPAWFIQKLARFHKPTWLLKKRKELKGQLLYCDVDAFFHKDPWLYLGLYDGDVAVFRRRDGVVNSATILLNDTKEAEDLLLEWERRCIAKRDEVARAWPNVAPSASDQPLLTDIVKENDASKGFRIQLLPPSMLYVFDFEKGVPLGSIFIEQLQASRVAKSSTKRVVSEASESARDKRIRELEAILRTKV